MGLLQDGIEEWKSLPTWGKVAVGVALAALVYFVYAHRHASGTTLGLSNQDTGGSGGWSGGTEAGTAPSSSLPPDNTFQPDPGAWTWPVDPNPVPSAAGAQAQQVIANTYGMPGPASDPAIQAFQQSEIANINAGNPAYTYPNLAPILKTDITGTAAQQVRTGEHAAITTPAPAPASKPAPVADTWWSDPQSYTPPPPPPAPAPVYQRANQRYS